MTEDVERAVAHLRAQFARAQPILFVGAGFSSAAINTAGTEIPLGGKLRRLLYELCFPGEKFDERSRLGDLYHHAAKRHPSHLKELLLKELTVRPGGLPTWYVKYFYAPWGRVYSLNLDTIPEEVLRIATFDRRLHAISAVSASTADLSTEATSRYLQYVRLNGGLEDVPSGAVFSRRSYGEKQSRPDPWYRALAAELVTRPVVFLGTELDEPPLWQHLADRGDRGRRDNSELRPRSYLVVPELERSRLATLSDFNVKWLPLSAEEFSHFVLDECGPDIEIGRNLLARKARGGQEPDSIPDVSELRSAPPTTNEFLLGGEPDWGDFIAGRVLERSVDDELWQLVTPAQGTATRNPIIALTGTAGSGKSASLKRLAIRISASGKSVRWIDRESEVSPAAIRQLATRLGSAAAYFLDDADVYGSELGSIVGFLANASGSPLVVVALRSGRFERVLPSERVDGLEIEEIVMPNLSDADISGLLDVLARENMLGLMRSQSRKEQEATLRDYCGRELLVAMIGATSGRKLEEKVVDELMELVPDEQRIYALVGVASALRFNLTREEVLLAADSTSNATLNALARLVRRGLLVQSASMEVRLRHRVLAEVLLKELQVQGLLSTLLPQLLRTVAGRVSPGMSPSARPARLLKALINHDFLIRTLGLEGARDCYGEIQDVLSWDSHFWLQRGSLEVEQGNLDLATNFLGQALALAPDDQLVQTEWHYLAMRRVLEAPGLPESADRADRAMKALEGLIVQRGRKDSYPFHVLGSQGLAWSRKGRMGREERAALLNRLISSVTQGRTLHPSRRELKDLLNDLQRELLSLLVPGS